MGFRTVVILNNDASSHWQHDASLGRRIINDQFASSRKDHEHGLGSDGEVVECVHTSGTHLLLVDYLQGYDITMPTIDSETGKIGGCERLDPQFIIRILKNAAGQLGYNLVKKPTKKNRRS